MRNAYPNLTDGANDANWRKRGARGGSNRRRVNNAPAHPRPRQGPPHPRQQQQPQQVHGPLQGHGSARSMIPAPLDRDHQYKPPPRGQPAQQGSTREAVPVLEQPVVVPPQVEAVPEPPADQGPVCPHWEKDGRCPLKRCHLHSTHTAANSPRYRKHNTITPLFDFSNGAAECDSNKAAPVIAPPIASPKVVAHSPAPRPLKPGAFALEIKDVPVAVR